MLTIESLSKTYPNGAVGMERVTLRIPPGVFGLLGPNGAGKSTLMRTLATLQSPDGGQAWLDDRDLIRDQAAARRSLGYLPQDFDLYPQLTAQQMLEHLAVLKGIGPAGHRRDLVQRMLALVNLGQYRRRALGTFSGGMRQRFGIAQAIIGEPRLLILDEPTAGLDPSERNRFHNLIARISEDRVVILSTHIVEDIDQLCPNMAIMNRGRILLAGTPADLKAQLAGRIWGRQLTPDELGQAETMPDAISTRLHAGVSEVHVVGITPPGPGFELRSPDLEDVYFTALFEDRSAADVVLET